VAPLVLGIVLGDLMEKSLRRGLVLSDGDLTPFFTRPIAGSIFALIAIILLMRAPFMKKLFKRQSP
jgi:putative tricarboxylic transport membrane protein